jgi:hypothetical protein
LNTNANYYITNKPDKYEPMRQTQQEIPWEQRIYKNKRYDCELLHTMKDISIILANYKLIDVATDGSHDPTTGKMSFGWVVAVGEFIIAQGKGPAEGHPTLASAFRAEAYGLLASAQFLQHLISTFQMTINRYQWFFHIFLDNKALIDRMLLYDSSTVTGKSTQWPDADITITTYQILQKLKVQYQHVKSHQDRNNNTDKLSFPARMNKIADELARHHCGTMKAPQTKVTEEFCLLRIDERYITRDLQKCILDASSQIPIRQYLKEKHGWNSLVFDLINWEMQYKTLTTYDNNDQQRILKFVHDWLPTNHRMYHEQLSTTQRCPLCHYRIEDNWHLLQCLYPKQRQTIMELKEKLVEHGKQAQIGELIASAVPECILNRKWQADTRKYNSELTSGIQEQNKIGWHQVICGRIATSLTDLDNPRSSQSTQKILKTIWDTILILWQQRNDIIYNNTTKTKADRQREKMEAKVERIYEYQTHLNILDRNKVFTKEKSELIKDDPRQIKTWIQMAERIIRVHKREVKRIHRKKTMMEQYFKWHPPDKTTVCTESAASGSTIRIG